MNIQSINDDFNYNNITLGNPQSIQGGSYYAKIFTGDSSLIYVQLPKCLTKQGIMSTKKNKYCDLMYERSDSNILIDWIEKIEEKTIKTISDKKDIWFHNELTNSDIETMTNPISRSFKSGKYILIRTNIDCNKHTGKSKCIGYDEKETCVDIETLESATNIIPLILLEGVRFTSRSFEIDIKLIQFMTIDKSVIEHKCLIKKTDKKESTSDHLGKENIKGESKDIESKPSSPINVDPMTSYQIKDKIESPKLIKSEHDIHIEKDSTNDADTNDADTNEADTNRTDTNETDTNDADTNEADTNRTDTNRTDTNDADTNDADANEADANDDGMNKVGMNKADTNNVGMNKADINELMNDTECDIVDNDNIEKSLDIVSSLEKNEIEEITLDVTGENLDEIKIREPNEIYYEIYQRAKHKAKEFKTKALKAYLEAKQIKVKYMLDDSDDSDNDEIQNYLD